MCYFICSQLLPVNVALCNINVVNCYIFQNIPESLIEKVGGKVYTFGSYRLGINAKGELYTRWSWSQSWPLMAISRPVEISSKLLLYCLFWAYGFICRICHSCYLMVDCRWMSDVQCCALFWTVHRRYFLVCHIFLCFLLNLSSHILYGVLLLLIMWLKECSLLALIWFNNLQLVFLLPWY